MKPLLSEQWVQMSVESYGRSAKEHLFLLVLPLATVTMNGQLDSDSGLFVPGAGKGSERESQLEKF